MKYANIHALMDAHLALVSGLPPLKTENKAYQPTTGQPWTRAVLRTTESVRESSMSTRYGGLYLIDLFYPQDTGVAAANAMADAVIAHFKAAPLGRLQDAEVTVQLQNAWRDAAGRQEPFYGVQVVVRWHALI